jgi:cytochrome c biogenesis protein CcdA/thiol-disulfide isomerase/thioredoxin
MSLLILAFLAGVLTALAPCVLPLLPIIVGGSISATNPRRPFVIVGSLVASLFFFTVALKATTTLLGVPPLVWQVLSGVILIALGITNVWPRLYEQFAARSGFASRSQTFMSNHATQKGLGSAILTGVALGPVFSSCSPTYALILATVLPVSFSLGLVYLGVYIVGLALMLLLVILLGRKLISRLGWALDSNGWFKRTLGITFILLGLAVITGTDKQVESYVAGIKYFNISNLETPFLPKSTGVSSNAGASTTQSNGAVFALQDPVKAPELIGITDWINSDGETIAGLKGKVVLIDFWTYSCINCIHTLPHVTSWYDKYKDKGLVVIGVHAPEFSFEHVKSNVAKAVADDNIRYPVALDNSFATWNAYGNQYWPAEYFIDRTGNIRHFKFGEGDYANDERVIQELLAENGTKVDRAVAPNSSALPSSAQSPETYLGYERASSNANSDSLKHDSASTYSLPSSLKANAWALGGSWNVGAKDTISGANASLKFNFSAKQVYLVMGANSPSQITVKLNGQSVVAQRIAGSDVDSSDHANIQESRLYRLINSPVMLKNATLELDFPPGVSINAFTFDS